MIHAAPKYVADFSLALINRTGAYHVCRDLVQGLPEYFVRTRYWRLELVREPQGLMRKVLGRLMLMELMGRQGAVGKAGSQPTVFMDPLYVLGRALAPSDIVLCHDVGPLSHSWLFEPRTVDAYTRAYDLIARVGPGMVFVSEASRQAFIRLFGTAFRFMHVIPLYVRDGVDEGEALRPVGVPDRFLLTVAATEVRKNFARSLEAYRESGLAERGVGYVICGPRANAEAEVATLAARTPGVVKLGFVSDVELRWLYQSAAGFVLPSLLEGFGVPALEAGRRGLVPLVSADGALAEAAGPGGLTVDADDVAALAEGMVRLVDMPDDERARRIALLRDHARVHTRAIYLKRWADVLDGEAVPARERERKYG